VDAAAQHRSRENRAQIVAAVVEAGDDAAVGWVGELDDEGRACDVADDSAKAQEEAPGKKLRQLVRNTFNDCS
jgi:histidinol dehydrogenase